MELKRESNPCGYVKVDGMGKGAVERVFAGELIHSTVRHSRGVLPETGMLSPTGAWLGRIFMVGVLTEVTRKGEEVHRARLSDPTGTVELVFRPHNLPPADQLRTMNPPAFLAVTGSVRLQGDRVVIEPDMLAPVQRAERDDWVLFTADRTIRRMEALEEARRGGAGTEELRAVIAAYHPTDSDMQELAAMLRSALETVPAEVRPSFDAQAVVREILAAGEGALEIAWVLEKAGERGVGEEEARRCLQQLLAEGECYSPRNGHIRLL
jgi:RPA family protein